MNCDIIEWLKEEKKFLNKKLDVPGGSHQLGTNNFFHLIGELSFLEKIENKIFTLNCIGEKK